MKVLVFLSWNKTNKLKTKVIVFIDSLVVNNKWQF